MVLAHNVEEVQRTRDIHISVNVTFDSMLLSNTTLGGLKSSGFYKPSPIQLHGVPLGKCGFDLILEAKSGTGKTAVFSIIALEQLDLDKGLQSIILAPTREIAAQVKDVIEQIGSCYNDLNVEVVMGGLSVGEDIEKFKKQVHILVGSPGRMRHLIQDKHVDVSSVRLLVLDEADKLMEKSFQPDINFIFSALPKQKQVILSSATYPDKAIIQNYVKKAQHICPDSTNILLGIKQLITVVESNVNVVRQTKNKFEELLKILSNQEFRQCLIFCNYQVRVGELCKMLTREKWPAEQLHGQLEQTDRLDALKTLQEYKCRILVSTDLAARGIDASNVDLVINFEPPLEWQTYLHRIGRAGRFGSFGIAITILSQGKEQSEFKEMIKNIGASINMSYLWDEDRFGLDDSALNTATSENTVKGRKLSETSNMALKWKTLKMVETCTTLPVGDTHSVSNIKDTNHLQKVEETHESQKSEVKPVLFVKEEACRETKITEMDKAPKIEERKILEVDICKTQLQEPKVIVEIIETPQVTKEENLVEEILNISNCEQIESNKGIHSFNKIISSFQKSKCNIESFDELITSFKEYEPNNNETSESEDATFTAKLFSMLDEDAHPNIILASNSDTDTEEKQHEDDKLDKKKSGTNMKQKSTIQINNNLLPSKNNIEHEATQDNTSYKALVDAGLPTSFGSTKYSNRNPVKDSKQHGNKNETNKQKSNNNRCKDVNNRNKCQLTRKLVRDVNVKSSTEASTSFDDDGYNTQSGLLSRSTKCISSQNDNNWNISNKNDKISHDKIETRFEADRKYKNWYKQLKMHIQQVEMSLYIEELSKLRF